MTPLRSLLALAALSLSSAPALAFADDATVPGTFATVQAALNGATDVDGDGKITIRLGVGTFTGAFTATRNDLVLAGSGPATILRGPTGTAELPVLAAELIDGFELRDLTVRGTAFKPGFDAVDVTGLVVSNVRIELAVEAGGVRGCDGAVIENLTVADCGSGFLLRDSIGVELRSGLFENNELEGLAIRGCVNTVVGGAGSVIVRDNVGAGIFIRRSFQTSLLGVVCTGNVEDGLFVRENVDLLVDGCTISDNGGFGVFMRRSVGLDFDSATAGAQPLVGTNTVENNALGLSNF